MADQILKSIGFPPRTLNIIDLYANSEDLSRSKAVVKMAEEFIVRHRLDKKYYPKNTIIK